MRDFLNNGEMNVDGNFIINDNSENEVSKLLINCTTEELLEERPFRQENLYLERKRKIKNSFPALLTAICCFIAAAILGLINGKPDIVSFFLGLGSIVTGLASVEGILKPNDFEIHEQSAIHQINLILKSRRIE
jgi:hypothetical protein